MSGRSPIAVCLTVALALQIGLGGADDWTASCSSNCTCKWTNGKKSAICSSLELTAIPTTLSTELQVLVLNDNHIPYLNREEFTNLGLLNLQRIYLKKSEVQYMHKETFRNLKILVEIDLSDNRIEQIDKDTFMGNDRLRILYLNGNPLKRLTAYQFPILPHLRTLDLHDCLLSDIDPMALANLNLLEFLYLKNNLLESLSEYVFQHMTNLKTLVLDENPWQCNCKLRKFRTWYVQSKLNSVSLLCKGPPAHMDKSWEHVAEAQFGCAPRVEIFNNEDVQNIEIGSNTTFSCLVYGDPLPLVSWQLNGKSMDNENVMVEGENVASDKLWSNLTVFNMTSLDAGTYACTGANVVGAATQNISIYLTEIVQHVLVKTPETFWYFGLIMGTFGTVFLLVVISFVVCLCKRGTRTRRHPSKTGGVKPSVSFNDQEKKLLDLSITTTTNERGDSCGIDNNTTATVTTSTSHTSTNNAMSKTESVIGFEPIEIHHSVDNHRSLVHNGGMHQHGQHGASRQQQLMAVADGSCSVVGIPTSMGTHTLMSGGAHAQLPEEFPLNVGVFPPPPEFCSNIVPNPAYGNIFISVSVTQDMLDGADLSMYPDLLNIPKRMQDSGGDTASAQQQQALTHGGATTIMSPPTSSSSSSAGGMSVASFATLPRNTQRRGILKKESSLQHHHHQQQQQQFHTNNLYPHDEIVSYHNLETSYSQGYQEHQQQQQQLQQHLQQQLQRANNIVGLPPPPPPPQTCHHAASTQAPKPCAGCLNSMSQVPPSQPPLAPPSTASACSSPPVEATAMRPLGKGAGSAATGTACLKYDNMGRRITASGNSTLSLPDEERLENETLFNGGSPRTKLAALPNGKCQTDCDGDEGKSSTAPSNETAVEGVSSNGGEFVTL